MDFKVGDKVVFTGKIENDMTHGKTYQVCDIEDDLLLIIDDAGDDHFMYASNLKPATDNNTDDTMIDFAERAATYGIKITVIVGDMQVVYDGSE